MRLAERLTERLAERAEQPAEQPVELPAELPAQRLALTRELMLVRLLRSQQPVARPRPQRQQRPMKLD